MEVEVSTPSVAQMRKLRLGHPVRLKLGKGLKVMLPPKEVKKLEKAHKKGAAATITGAGMHGYGLAEQAVRMAKSKAKHGMYGGEVVPKGNVKSVAKEQGKRLLVAGTDRAVRALEGSGLVDALVTRAVMDGSGVRSASRASSALNMGGKVNRRKKFNKWFKDIGQKFKPIAKNLKPIKEAATARAVDFIENYNNPQAQAKSAIDLAQSEFKDTAKLVGKKRSASSGSASVADDSYQSLRRGTFIQPNPTPSAPREPPQAVDVNDDGEPDGYFFPNEASFFGAGRGRGAPTSEQGRAMLRGGMGRPTIQPVVRPQLARGAGAKKTSPWIAHVKAYCKKHGCKYGEGLKLAKASYKGSGSVERRVGEGMHGRALFPAGYDPRFDR